ncbi:unnamed protein product [Nippostrongylus brasiliensis]|uniref:Uncharacterized protein n=1 Tax=Nippostrongylus brasiliensis TaxID=27835 RepID=A0A0N4XZ78_NIPBR|nr:unnamed protein product [Nippostrongylus brasiliensis]
MLASVRADLVGPPSYVATRSSSGTRMSTITVLLVAISLPLADSICIQCASPTLQNMWQLTGFPNHPANLPFVPQCDSVSATTNDLADPAMEKKGCSSYCFEMVLPFKNQYHYVRGCHADFVGNKTPATGNDVLCYYSKITDQVIEIAPTNTAKFPVAIMRFVKDKGEEDRENVEYQDSSLASKTLNKSLPKTCVKSMYYDGTGEDNNKQTCTGAYCTSVEGKLNGEKCNTSSTHMTMSVLIASALMSVVIRFLY